MINHLFKDTLGAALGIGCIISGMFFAPETIDMSRNGVQLTKNFHSSEWFVRGERNYNQDWEFTPAVFRMQSYYTNKKTGDIVYIHELMPTATYLQAVRDCLGHPISINSGVRDDAHNASLPNAADDSKHLPIAYKKGEGAVDFVPGGGTQAELAECIQVVKPHSGGLGLYNSWIHVDLRVDGPARWDFRG